MTVKWNGDVRVSLKELAEICCANFKHITEELIRLEKRIREIDDRNAKDNDGD